MSTTAAKVLFGLYLAVIAIATILPIVAGIASLFYP